MKSSSTPYGLCAPVISRAEAINSGPLSTRAGIAGYPCIAQPARACVPTTDALGYENSGCTASAYRLHSSSSVSARKTRPCSSRSETKSMVQISLSIGAARRNALPTDVLLLGCAAGGVSKYADLPDDTGAEIAFSSCRNHPQRVTSPGSRGSRRVACSPIVGALVPVP